MARHLWALLLWVPALAAAEDLDVRLPEGVEPLRAYYATPVGEGICTVELLASAEGPGIDWARAAAPSAQVTFPRQCQAIAASHACIACVLDGEPTRRDCGPVDLSAARARIYPVCAATYVQGGGGGLPPDPPEPEPSPQPEPAPVPAPEPPTWSRFVALDLEGQALHDPYAGEVLPRFGFVLCGAVQGGELRSAFFRVAGVGVHPNRDEQDPGLCPGIEGMHVPVGMVDDAGMGTFKVEAHPFGFLRGEDGPRGPRVVLEVTVEDAESPEPIPSAPLLLRVAPAP